MIYRDAKTAFHYLGVFPANKIPNYMPPNSCAIINNKNHYEMGEHWIALHMNRNDVLEFYDSYGMNANFYKLTRKLPRHRRILYNKRHLQHLLSTVCGYYCLHFLYYKTRGYTLSYVNRNFCRDQNSNDNYVYYKTKQLYDIT